MVLVPHASPHQSVRTRDDAHDMPPLLGRWAHVANTFLPGSGTPITASPSDVTDAQWDKIAPLLRTASSKLGRQPRNHREVLNGILFVLTTESAWRKLPTRYGNYVTCWRRLLRWQNSGVWVSIQRVLAATNHPLMAKGTPYSGK